MTHREPQHAPEIPAEHLEMKIPARAEWVRVVRLATTGVCSRVGFSYDEIEDIKLAVAEACNNAILHFAPDEENASNSGESPSGSTPVVTIRWRVFEGGVRVSVSDEGRLPAGLKRKAGSTPDRNIADDDSLDELPEGGMGLILIESLMDEVQHDSGPQLDTTIHMTKRVKPVLESANAESKMPPARLDPDAPIVLKSASQRAQTPHSSR